jgi:FkbM family methyltransferase
MFRSGGISHSAVTSRQEWNRFLLYAPDFAHQVRPQGSYVIRRGILTNLDAGELCAEVNRQLAQLSYVYKDKNSIQTLSIAGHRAVCFPQSAGGGVAGGSAAWIRAKHEKGDVHEPGLIAALLAIQKVQPSIQTIFDIGALYGYFSLISRSLFAKSSVHAFEVNPNSYNALRNNIAANKRGIRSRITAHHCALSDATSMQSQLRVRQFKVEPVTEQSSQGEKSVYNIDVWALDDFCRSKKLSPDIVKLDVEGFQAKIIPGAMEVIKAARPIVLLEFDGKESVNNFGITDKAVIKPLIDQGYRLVWGRHRIKDTTFRVIDWEELAARHERNSLGILVP